MEVVIKVCTNNLVIMPYIHIYITGNVTDYKQPVISADDTEMPKHFQKIFIPSVH